MKLKDHTFTIKTERAILFSVILPDAREEDPIEELRLLSEAAGASVIHTLTQNRINVDPKYYLGKGKATELSNLSKELDADVLICDDDLSPAQVKNLEKLTGRKVIDRSEVILDIFATHARTRQAKLQVELAQLEYTRPRLKRMWTHLSRIEGGIGTRGPGEKQLEVDKRIIAKKIYDLRRKLHEIEERQERIVASRKEFFTVSIVGYTNAGKSTLMNVLTDAHTHVEDKLFATLDTKTGVCNLDSGLKILISDTVGFIRKLPHHLVSSFKATLEETRNADLLLHVVDTSSSNVFRQIEAVNAVLKELKCDEKPVILVLNKIDAVNDESVIPLIKNRFANSVAISAKNRQGVWGLKQKIEEILEHDFIEVELSCSPANGKLIAYLHEHTHILSSQFYDQVVIFRLLLDNKLLKKLHTMYGDIHIKVKERQLGLG